MLLIYDENEQTHAPHTITQLLTLFPNAIKGNLDYGDVQVILDNGKRLAVERKTIGDFLASIADKRLPSQVERMSKADYSAIIVIGHMTYDENDMVIANGELTKWDGVSVRGMLYAVQFSACPIIWSKDSSYARFILDLANFVSKPNEHWQTQYRRIITFPPIDDITDFIANIPLPSTGVRRQTVGLKKAISLIESTGKNGGIGTLAACLTWGCMLDLIALDSRPAGWGKKTIEGFRQTMGLKPGQYLDFKYQNEAGS